ncbi:hypothetical protein HK100_006347 [Physocladia obscura]|uniref:Major facilitator superfamily (MFS) profile domain-containing protein n=1 Tax=Physocladia obscura TaxID=109957 RepID=A0AAD5XIL1_9FUNG|nr:hypothetical protein HK100_006347 [Physocladia obscura]
MVRDFGLSNEKEVGFYVGFIASSFSLAQFMTSLLWGWVSDRVGRRPVLLTGLLGNAISLLIGILNGNVGIAKCVIGEVTDSTNQSFGFSLIGIMWSLGTILGPIIGGCLAYPVETYPHIFPNGNEFLERNPFFLPCAVSATVSLVGFVVGFFLLEETNPKRQIQIGGYIAVNEVIGETGCGIFENNCQIGNEQPDAFRNSISTLDGGSGRSDSSGRSSSQRLSSNCLDIEDDLRNHCSVSSLEPVQQESGIFNAIDKKARQAIIAYSLLAFQNIILDEVFSLWIVTPTRDGGLGYDSAQVGVVLSIIGTLALYLQLVVYPYLSWHYSPLTLFRTGAILYIIPYATYPVLSGIINPAFENKTIFCNVLTYTSIFILINNTATGENLGLVNGVAQTSASFVRSIGPALGGILWAWSITNGLGFPFNHYFVFACIVLWGLGTVWYSYKVVDDDGCRYISGTDTNTEYSAFEMGTGFVVIGHGLSMVLGLCIILPLSGLAMRFYTFATPNQRLMTHLWLGVSGAVTTSIGVGLLHVGHVKTAITSNADHGIPVAAYTTTPDYSVHFLLGFAVVGFLLPLQLFVGLSAKRFRFWDQIHRSIAVALIVSAFANSWIALAYVPVEYLNASVILFWLWLALLVAVFLVLEYRRRFFTRIVAVSENEALLADNNANTDSVGTIIIVP